MEKCKPPGMDLIFIVDSSGSSKPDNFQHARDFIISIINASNPDQNNRYGIVDFSDVVIVSLELTDNLTKAITATQDLVYIDQGTDIASGIIKANQMFMRDGRIEVPMVALLITDGEPNVGQDPVGATFQAADDIKSEGVNLFTVGVGNQAPVNLQQWGRFFVGLINRIFNKSAFSISSKLHVLLHLG